MDDQQQETVVREDSDRAREQLRDAGDSGGIIVNYSSNDDDDDGVVAESVNLSNEQRYQSDQDNSMGSKYFDDEAAAAGAEQHGESQEKGGGGGHLDKQQTTMTLQRSNQVRRLDSERFVHQKQSMAQTILVMKKKDKQPLRKIYGIFEAHGKEYLYDTRSLFIFDQSWCLRKAIVWLVEWTWFKNFILLTIIFNSVMLAAEDYEKRVHTTYEQTTLDKVSKLGNIVSTWIFIVEFVLKIIAMGFLLHKKSYLRHAWNILDFLTVIIGIFELAQLNAGSFTLLRMLRLLKPLRSIKAFTTLRFLIGSLLASLAGLLNVFIFLGFVFSVFATLGVNIYPGKTYTFCRLSDEVIYPEDGSDPYWPKIPDFDHLCVSDDFCRAKSGIETAVCGSIWDKAGLDPVRYDDVRNNELILYGIPGFDNFGQALYTVFQICTLESWSYLMYNFEEAGDQPLITYWFFTSIVIFGAFFTMNLILANILDSFNTEQSNMEAKERQLIERSRMQREIENTELLEQQRSQEVKLAATKALTATGQVIEQTMNFPDMLFLDNPNVQNVTQSRKKEQQAQVRRDSRIIRLNSLNQNNLMVPSVQQPQRRATSPAGKVGSLLELQKLYEAGAFANSGNSSSGSKLSNEISSDSVSRSQSSRAHHFALPEITAPNQEQIVFQDHDISDMAVDVNQNGAHLSIERTMYADNSIELINRSDLNLVFNEIDTQKDGADNGDNQNLYIPQYDSPVANQGAAASTRQRGHLDSQEQSQSQREDSKANGDIDQSNRNPSADLEVATPDSQAKNLDLATSGGGKAPISSFFSSIVNSIIFNITMILLILANTVTMATYSHDQPESERDLIHIFDYIFDAAFFLEMVFKLIGGGPRAYVADKWNLFDGLIVIMSFVDLTMTLIGISQSDGVVSNVFQFVRLLRLLRMLKLARYFEGMRVMLIKTAKSLHDIGPFAFLLFIFIYLFALIGRELFAFTAMIDEDGEIIYGQQTLIDYQLSGKLVRYPRVNFNTFWTSMTAVFILVNGEDWTWIAQDWIRASGDDGRLGENTATVYFVTLMLIGHLTLFALFTGTLLHSFKQNSKRYNQAKKNKEGDQNEGGTEGKIFVEKALINAFKRCIAACQSIIITSESAKDKKKKAATPATEVQAEEPHGDDDPFKEINEIMQQEAPVRHSLSRNKSKRRNTLFELNMSTELAHYDFNSLRSKKKKDSLKQILALKINLEGNSLGLFSPENRFRIFCSSITQHWLFQLFVLILIVVTSVFLALESPLRDPNGTREKNLKKADQIITALFVVEAILKIVTLGFVRNGKNSYFRSPWNMLDFFIVLTSVAEIAAAQTESLHTIKTLRIMRLLRPIRLLSRNSTLKSAIMSLLKSVPKIFELLTLIVLLVFLFAVFETYLFSGKFNYCYMEHLKLNIRQEQRLIKTKWDCLNYGGEWVTPQLNFDTVATAMLALSSIQSHEGWLGMMWSSVDATDVDLMPELNRNPYVFIPFTLFVIFAICLLFLNLFVGVVIETFNAQKEILTNNHLLTHAARTHLMTQLNTFKMQPRMTLQPEPDTPWIRKVCIKIVQNPKFEPFIVISILLNTIVLAANHFMMSSEFEQVLEGLNLFFTVIFILEAAIKITALKRAYFSDSWNIFDFTIIVLAFIIMILIEVLGSMKELQRLTTTIRVLRVARMLRLVVKAKKLAIIFQTLFDAGPTFASIGFFLALSIYMFAIIGMQLFSLQDLRHAPGLDQELGYHANFQTFLSSFMTMLRCATGENWNQIMFECAKTRDILYQCVEDESYESIVAAGRDPQDWLGPRGCGSPLASIVFHIVFQLVITQIFLNLFIAITVDAFMGVTEKFQLPVTTESMFVFSELWSKYDPKATGFIDIKDLDKLLVDISNQKEARELLILVDYVKESAFYREKLIEQLEIPTFNKLKKVMFYDTLQKLTMRIVKLSSIREELEDNIKRLKVLERISGKGEKFVVQHLEICKMKTDYQLHFDEMLKRLDNMDVEIELITRLRAKTKNLNKMYSHLVDNSLQVPSRTGQKAIKIGEINENLNQYIMIFTTRHYVAGLVIARWYHGILQSRHESRSDKPKNDNPKRHDSSLPPES